MKHNPSLYSQPAKWTSSTNLLHFILPFPARSQEISETGELIGELSKGPQEAQRAPKKDVKSPPKGGNEQKRKKNIQKKIQKSK